MSERFGRLVVVGEAGAVNGRRMVKCVCDCGTQRTVLISSLRYGSTQSCGCLQRERVANAQRTHGHSGRGRYTKAYNAWFSMLARCRAPSHPSYPNYGGRGITVCERWLEFEGFLADMGEPHPDLTLDRIDNDRLVDSYCKDNCRWTTRAEQTRNRRATKLTPDLVNEIRGRHEHGEGPTSIARRIGVSKGAIIGVVHRKTWADIP